MVQRNALIATLPKAGTWYCHFFFWCYDQLLANADAFIEGDFTPDMVGAIAKHKMHNPSSPKEYNIDKLFICHSICPGFRRIDDVHYYSWQNIRFPLPYNWGESWMHDSNDWDTLDPTRTQAARVIYLYRNPLDHFVSLYAHTHNHKDESHRFKVRADGTRAPVRNLHDFVFDFGVLGAFIKQYYSFRQMALRFPEQVLMVPYERLTTRPHETFAEILSFMGCAPDTDIRQRLLSEAVALCSKESLKQVEAAVGHSLAGDQKGGESHIRGGAIGKWQGRFSDAEIEKIESVLNAFDISLHDFTLAENAQERAQALRAIAHIEPLKKSQHQLEFFEMQEARSGGHILALREEQIIRLQELMRKVRFSKPWGIVAPPMRATRDLLRKSFA